jgi:hypothetical protein
VGVSPELDKKINAGFRGKRLNAENKGKTEADILRSGTRPIPMI